MCYSNSTTSFVALTWPHPLSPHAIGWTCGFATPTPAKLAYNVTAPAACAYVDRDYYRLSSHNFDGTCCTSPGGMSLVTMPFITQNNHQSTCSFGWKGGLGCSCFSLTRVLCLFFFVNVVFSVQHFYYNELF